MKILLFVLFPVFSFSQLCKQRTAIGAGLTFGVSSLRTPVAEMYFGFKAATHIAIYPLAIKINGTSDPTIPQIFETRVAYTRNNWELYFGGGYHFAGQDGKQEFKKYAGFKPGFGVIKHMGKFIVASGMAGKVWTLQVGVFGFR